MAYQQLRSYLARIVARVFRSVDLALGVVFYPFKGTLSFELVGTAGLHRYFDLTGVDPIRDLGDTCDGYIELILRQSRQACQHRFNLLGSGWVHLVYGMECKGLEGVRYPAVTQGSIDRAGDWLKNLVNPGNLGNARAIWQMVGSDYTPIDWQLDFKSGYRWSASCWHKNIRYGQVPAADVKVPWELSRLQHLPVLAIAYQHARAGHAGYDAASIYAEEFKNQVLDFLANNPPGFGVNWACTMDVAIRISNMLVAYDLFTAAGYEFESDFVRVFIASVRSHGRHIVHNLEWSERHRGNHYLANIAGLLFIAAYLPCDAESNGWLTFSVQQLLKEIDHQFHEDGCNFEASTCYHRLSAEMVLWCTALLFNLQEEKLQILSGSAAGEKRPSSPVKAPIQLYATADGWLTPLPPWCWQRLAKMARVTSSLTKPNGLIPQIGDNDSGRFMPFASGEQIRARNDPAAPGWSLDHGALVAGVHGLIAGAEGDDVIACDPNSYWLRLLAGGHRVTLDEDEVDSMPEPSAHDEVWDSVTSLYAQAAETSRWAGRYAASSACLRDGLLWAGHVGLGGFVFKSPHLYLLIRCGSIGLSGLGAHAHCDQLGVELVIEGNECIRDPGSFLYTPFPELRNQYRSAAAHHVPRVAGREPAVLGRGLFDLRTAEEGECLYFGSKGFIGRHKGYGAWVYRIVSIHSDCIEIRDFSDGELRVVDPSVSSVRFSQGYGLTQQE